MANNLPFFWPPHPHPTSSNSNPCQLLSLSISAPLTLNVSILCIYLDSLSFLSPNPSSTLTRPLRLSFSPGARREGFGLLSGGSEGSLLLWAVWQAVPQTPGVWQSHQLLRPRTQTGIWDAPALQLNTRMLQTDTQADISYDLSPWNLGVLALCVLTESYVTSPCQSTHRVQFPSR